VSFKEIIGQESAVFFLKAAHRHNRMAHAYMFVGPDGIGKKKTALNFAKLFLCEHPEAEEPCERCSSCRKAEASAHPDIQEVACEGQFIKIDAIREACRRLNLRGFESLKKVLIISEAQHLNDESSNALLKTLEEPTPHTVIILIVDTVKSILPTIASRCQKIAFSLLSEKTIRSILREDFGAGEEAATYLARMAQGSLGNALKYQQEGLFDRKNDLIWEVLDRRFSLSRFMSEAALDRSERQEKISEVLVVLSSWFEDLYKAKIVSDSEDFINSDRRKDIVRQAGLLSFSEIEERLQAIADALNDLERHINMRILLSKLRVELWK
jgi:DNA polymerase-3 subunit delta'